MFLNISDSELFQIMFGQVRLVEMIGFIWFFFIGYFLYGLSETTGRDRRSRRTPKKWSWKFWYRDNWRRYLTSILATYILFRFYTEISGHPFGNFDAVTIGMIGDGIAATLKKRVKVIGNHHHNIEEYDNHNNDSHDSDYDGGHDTDYDNNNNDNLDV